jgi:NADPH:quinone reductase-like Zn-dependent oxidoreductase
MSNTTPNLAAILPSKASHLRLEERAIPSPGPDELLIRNHAIAINPVDVKRQTIGLYVSSYPVILGADISGVVVATGSAVTSFKPGDRVLGAGPGVATGNLDHGAFQTYTLVQATSATKLPDTVDFKQGATLPTAIATATIALFDILGLPTPGADPTASPKSSASSILIWGGASSAGSATIQLARVAGLKVFATASPKHHAHVLSLGASAVVDYRSPTAVDELVAAAKAAGTEIRYAVDAVSTTETLPLVVETLSRFEGAKKMTHFLPWPEQVAKPDDVEATMTRAMKVWGEKRDLAQLVFNGLLRGWLETGEVVPQAVKVVEGGVRGLQAALDELNKGVSGVKVVVEV